MKIKNRDARRLWLDAQGLAVAPTGSLDVLQIIKDLGFVQLDTIRNVTRAHHHILWSRNQNYREEMLNELLADDRTIFEHFTHDASVLPVEYYPMWQRQFRRLQEKTNRSDFYRSSLNQGEMEAIKQRIADEGPLSTHAFDTKIEGPKEMWARPPHKKALDHMWYAGELATSHRENFTKFYDLKERCIPEDLCQRDHEDAEQVDWLCHGALDRMGFGSTGDIQRFWGAMTAVEAKTWVAENEGSLIRVEVECADRSIMNIYAPLDIEQRIDAVKEPTSRLRILNPFDPVVRDRNRLSRLFGFEYRNEMFVPAAKRQWGYYVYPMLEGDRFVGRIELKADRKKGELIVHQIWQEPGKRWTTKRNQKLEAELDRLRRFIGAEKIIWLCDKLH